MSWKSVVVEQVLKEEKNVISFLQEMHQKSYPHGDEIPPKYEFSQEGPAWVAHCCYKNNVVKVIRFESGHKFLDY